MNIVIKKMETDAEIKGKAYVHWKSWQEAYSGIVDQRYLDSLTLDKCEKIAFRRTDNVIIAKDGDSVIGFVGFGKYRNDELENAGEVFAVYILSQYYGKGIGYRLMQAALSELADYSKIAVWVLKENTRAIRFYERCGYRFDGREQIIELGSPVVAARMVFASSLASVLVKPLGCNCFWVHLWGETESAKTVLAMTAASIWGNPEIGDYIMTFNATTVGMEKTAAFYNNLPYILDELQIINDKRDLDNLIYMLTEGSGRSRGNKLGGLDAVPKWKNAVITTGERPITTARSGGGSVNRVIEIECKEKFFDDPRHVANTVKANYGFFGKMFVQKLIKDGFGHAEELFDSYQKKLIADYDIMQKQAQSAALILTADTLMCKMLGVEETALKTEEVAEFLKTKASVSVNPRAYEYMCSFVALNSTRFVYNPDKPIDQWGVLPGDKQSVYIAVPVFRKVCEEEGYNSQALLSYLRDNHLIEIDKKGKNSVNKRVNGLGTRCVHLTLPSEDDAKYDDIDF